MRKLVSGSTETADGKCDRIMDENMKITILCVGKIKERYWNEAIAEYEKRLGGRYCSLKVVEVADERTIEGASAAQAAQVLEKEGARLSEKLDSLAAGPDTYVFALAIKGKSCDSVGFSEQISRLGVNGKSHLIFIIGGSLGLSEAVLRRADAKLSFSEMTFPHQLMRVILLEQLYRAFRIIHHEPYHK